jgi:hypothetical protein|tara:strand:- start:238 stop:420 length:183 start_codon:yes stop_codon:yes gene_type:complete
MSTSYPPIELEQDAYGSVIVPLSDELCHDLSLQPNERFEIEVDGDVVTLKRLTAGYEIVE